MTIEHVADVIVTEQPGQKVGLMALTEKGTNALLRVCNKLGYSMPQGYGNALLLDLEDDLAVAFHEIDTDSLTTITLG